MWMFRTQGTCSQAVFFDVKEDKIQSCEFLGGCPGNTQGVARLVEGRSVSEVISLLKGIQCRGGTSCPDQLARALEAYLAGDQDRLQQVEKGMD